MSFLKKAVKKVFRFVKKVVKSKIFKWVAIAALVFFTAGVAAGGFAAFAAGSVTGVGSFFVAVGQTIATGASFIASSLGFQGISASLAQHGGAAAIQAGLTTTATSASGVALSANALTGTITGTGTATTEALALSAKGIAAADAAAGTVVNLGGLTSAEVTAGLTGEAVKGGVYQASTTGLGQITSGLTGTAAKTGVSTNVWRGVQVGFAAYAASKSSKRDKKGPTFVAGGLSHGGSATLGPQPFFVVGGKSPQSSAGEDVVDTTAPTLAGELSRRAADRVAGFRGGEGSSALQVAGAQTPVEPSVEGPAQVGGLPTDVQATGVLAQAPQQDRGVVGNFLGESAPTDITARDAGNFDDRVFKGALGRRV